MAQHILREAVQNKVQAQGLRHLQQQVARLEDLLDYLAGRLSPQAVEPGTVELAHYSRLLQERVEAVLLYQKVAQHWSDSGKRQAGKLLDQVILAHRDLSRMLRERSAKLAREIECIDQTTRHRLAPIPRSYRNAERTARMFDLRG